MLDRRGEDLTRVVQDVAGIEHVVDLVPVVGTRATLAGSARLASGCVRDASLPHIGHQQQ
jgi:hypothetical protein